jgi:two-component system, OmpR family, response regulator
MQVAIVEDDALLRESLALFLRVKGCRVETFGSGEEAKAGNLVGFDVVISDLMLPGDDGLSLLRRVHAASNTVITVLVTAHGNRDFPEETRRAGIDGYIPKPFSTDELEGMLLRLTGKGRGGSPAALEATT